jgi:predicted acetyltransferase
MAAVTIEVRPGERSEFVAYARAVERAFGGEEDTVEQLASWERRVDGRFYVAADGATMLGGAADFAFRMSVPGGSVATAGVTGVGIIPTHRRQGLLTRLMDLELRTIKARGEPVAILWASEAAIYQRFGYGLAARSGSLELARSRAGYLSPGPGQGSLRLVDQQEASRLFPPIFERVHVRYPGAWARDEHWWAAYLDDPESRRRGGGPKTYVVHERQGQPDGYAFYRVTTDWGASGPTSTLRVFEALGDDPSATRELWRYLCDVDLVETIVARGGAAEHPLLLLLADPRALRLNVADGLWLRLVDVAAALEARRYLAADRLRFELADAFRPDQAGTYLLETDGDRARASRTEGAVDLLLDTADLAAAYLGGTTFQALADVGRVIARTPGSIERADAMFRSPVYPWSPGYF